MQNNFKWSTQEKKEAEKFKIWQYVEYSRILTLKPEAKA